jgi:hypothetical protein
MRQIQLVWTGDTLARLCGTGKESNRQFNSDFTLGYFCFTVAQTTLLYKIAIKMLRWFIELRRCLKHMPFL